MASQADPKHQIFPKHNPGKPLHTSVEHFPLSLGPFKVWQMDFIRLPPSQEYKYVLLMICMFSHCMEAFSCGRATASAINSLGSPLSCIVTGELIFTRQAVQSVCKIWLTLHFYCGYHLQFSGLVEETNRSSKFNWQNPWSLLICFSLKPFPWYFST